MGTDGSKSCKNPPQHKEEHHYSSGWRGFLSSLGVSVPSGLHIRSRRMIRDERTPVPEYVLSSLPGPEKLHVEWNLPAFINMFLPEFPHRSIPGHEHFQILGYIAKGSFGPILKVKDMSKQKTYAIKNPPQHKEEHHYSSGWRGFLSSLGVSVPSGLHIRSRRMIRDERTPVPEYVLSSLPGPEKLHVEWNLPAFINMFLPEFPHRSIPGHEHFQILGYIAKGSFGPILKVKDMSKQKTYAIKVIPKSEILRLGVLDQSKEEVIVQRQVRHPFVHDLQDCWQTQHHLYIMCDYCSTGDLYTYWVMIGHFGEDAVKVFAAELGSALGFLHDFGIIHRDVKMENVLLSDQGHLRLADFGLSRRLEQGRRAFTICGTIQYMAPEVLSGGPYSHAADWWSLGILLFALVTGKFPVPPESDHCCMLRKVRCFSYEMPRSFTPPFALLLTELLCKTPTRRLRTLERFKRQTFFRGTPFDSQLLQKSPMNLILELKKRPDRPARACRGLTLEPFPDFDFDCDFLRHSTSTSVQETLTLANVELVEAQDQGHVPRGNVLQGAFL